MPEACSSCHSFVIRKSNSKNFKSTFLEEGMKRTVMKTLNRLKNQSSNTNKNK